MKQCEYTTQLQIHHVMFKVCIVLFAYKSVLGTVFQYATVLLIEMLIILCVTIITGWSVHNVCLRRRSAFELISHCIAI